MGDVCRCSEGLATLRYDATDSERGGRSARFGLDMNGTKSSMAKICPRSLVGGSVPAQKNHLCNNRQTDGQCTLSFAVGCEAKNPTLAGCVAGQGLGECRLRHVQPVPPPPSARYTEQTASLP